ncbi:MAG: hypothetical protein LBC82_01500 [Oscillospiraceae bacterium]|jgi:hypothetical protein|nr:hypothetical protein [Oscillospiraceae bacterium]
MLFSSLFACAAMLSPVRFVYPATLKKEPDLENDARFSHTTLDRPMDYMFWRFKVKKGLNINKFERKYNRNGKMLFSFLGGEERT